MQKQKGVSLLVVVLIITVAVVVGGGGILVYQHYNPSPKPVACIPNWQCSWGACVNGSQSQIATDSNNCGVTTGNNIACPALAKVCNFSAQPSITITSPTANQTITSPILIKGQSNTFEGYDSIRIKDNNGKVLANDQAHGGSGQMSPYSKSVIYSAPSARNGTVEVYENSARDGSEINKVTVPVTFGDFNSTQPSITVTAPNGGEQWAQGSTHNITWRATGVNNVSIGIADFQTGLNIGHTIANVPASNGSYSWTIPSDNNYLPLGNTYKIVISEYGGPSEVFAVLTDESNKPFTIVAPPGSPSSITVTSPNGGEVWKIGETKNITWQVDRVSMVDIIAKDITGKIYSIDVGILSSRGSYSWVVGKYQGGYFFPAGQYKIEIKNTYTGAGTAPDFSNNYFTVAEFAEFANGVCGPANGTRVSVSPTINLCSSGLASSTMGVNNGGNIVYNWLCYGAGGGATVSCSATQN